MTMPMPTQSPRPDATTLTAGSPLARMTLAGQTCTLRITRQGKLILTKEDGQYCPSYDQSSTTLPDCPDRIAAKPASKSATPKRCVITRLTSSPFSSIAIILYQVSKISRP